MLLPVHLVSACVLEPQRLWCLCLKQMADSTDNHSL